MPDDARCHAWEYDGPHGTLPVGGLAGMSGTELRRMRMLAAFSSQGAPFRVSALAIVDKDGEDLHSRLMHRALNRVTRAPSAYK